MNLDPKLLGAGVAEIIKAHVARQLEPLRERIATLEAMLGVEAPPTAKRHKQGRRKP